MVETPMALKSSQPLIMAAIDSGTVRKCKLEASTMLNTHCSAQTMRESMRGRHSTMKAMAKSATRLICCTAVVMAECRESLTPKDCNSHASPPVMTQNKMMAKIFMENPLDEMPDT